MPRPNGVFDSNWYDNYATQAPWLFSADSDMRHLRADLLIVREEDKLTTTPAETLLNGSVPPHSVPTSRHNLRPTVPWHT